MSQSQKTNWGQFIPLVTVFFFWGFVAASNDILIPVFKKAFDLSQGQSQFVSLAFYIAYTVGSVIYMIISMIMGKDLINKIGYKNSLSLGLLISALGTLLFIPAANLESYPLMLSGLFTVALGFSLQQTVANPLAIALGNPNTGSQRLTLAGGINNLGTTIGPLIVAYAIFGSASDGNTELSIESVKIPYLCLGLAFLIVAIFLKFSSLPSHPDQEEETEESAANNKDRSSALKYPQLVLGMIAIFLYVGVEVSTASNLPDYMEKELGFTIAQVAPYVSLYWASMMIGRWGGAAEAFGLDKSKTMILKFVAPYLAFGVFLLVNLIAGHELQPFYFYAIIILVLILADISTKGNPARMILTFSVIGIIALLIGMNTSGLVSVYAITSVGLFCSTLWPCIFALAINGLGKNTSQGSSFLIMMIMGGGIVSYLQGILADKTSIHFSYIAGVICFAYLVFYALISPVLLKKQGISLSNVKSEGGH
ncbi:MFS transporter, FHS family, L-fucose permease [Algoriella xinjiangensis]|uniref:MFS transporter, FHS family, L-fucose permease n=1 Tax=Algoriella xinjiangensis TaxID=684065 RepID=A0A1I4W505_9FLAO|nr:MFS transporter [Algoriella xinjiangensis]SFN08804.1 MFS transporter, FHS family, L-fucose permease [Algoriella xinjiangensis]VDH15690.1 L-fucose permease [Algoriella xinjiangensis]